MNFLVDFFKSLIENIRERAKNPFNELNTTPFAGAFTLFFVICHWELFLSLFQFDSWETRLSKIEIVKAYFEKKAWWSDIVWPPIKFSFVSIIFFYVFTNASLVLTIGFNKWLKPFILFLLDRNKLAPKSDLEDMERKIHAVRNNIETLQDSLETAEKLTENHKATAEAERKKLIDYEIKERQFKILFAQYGKEGLYTPVTDIVIELMKKNAFSVSNKVLPDPNKYVFKELQIIYSFEKVIQTFVAAEEEVVELKDNRLTSTPTDFSRQLQLWQSNRPKLKDLINGEWTLIFSKDGTPNYERLRIDEYGRYFANDYHRFNLLIDINNEKIMLRKISLEKEEHSIETLQIVSDSEISGNDNLGYSLVYKKDDGTPVRIAMNIANQSKELMNQIILGSPELKTFNVETHENAIKKDYYTFTIMNGNRNFGEFLATFLKSKGVEYIDFKITQ